MLRDEEIKRFVKRRFEITGSPEQKAFDIAFGVIAPILCLVFDPGIFRMALAGARSYLGRFQILAYGSVGLGVVILAVSVMARIRSNYLLASVAGILLYGSVFSLGVGILLLPLSVIGLFFYMVGALGFIPFVTSFVFLRNGIGALRRARNGLDLKTMLVVMFLGIVLVGGLPIGLQSQADVIVSRSIQAIVDGDEEESHRAVQRLDRAFWCSAICYNEIVWAYMEEEDAGRRQRLANAYEELTGGDIEIQSLIGLD